MNRVDNINGTNYIKMNVITFWVRVRAWLEKSVVDIAMCRQTEKWSFKATVCTRVKDRL